MLQIKLFLKIVLALTCIPILFVLGFYIYTCNHKYEFHQVKEYMKIDKARNIIRKA